MVTGSWLDVVGAEVGGRGGNEIPPLPIPVLLNLLLVQSVSPTMPIISDSSDRDPHGGY